MNSPAFQRRAAGVGLQLRPRVLRFHLRGRRHPPDAARRLPALRHWATSRPAAAPRPTCDFYLSLVRGPACWPGAWPWPGAGTPATSFYDLGGREDGGGLGSDRPFRLLRGFPAGHQRGDRGWQFNLEYRLPLFKIEKAILPAVSLDRVWLSPFFDAGRLASRLRRRTRRLCRRRRGRAAPGLWRRHGHRPGLWRRPWLRARAAMVDLFADREKFLA